MTEYQTACLSSFDDLLFDLSLSIILKTEYQFAYSLGNGYGYKLSCFRFNRLIIREKLQFHIVLFVIRSRRENVETLNQFLKSIRLRLFRLKTFFVKRFQHLQAFVAT